MLFLVIAAGVVAVFFVGAFAANRAAWAPVGDNGVILVSTRQVLTANPPLLGEPTTSMRYGVESHHPGPLVFYLYAPFVAALGATRGLLTGAATVNAAAVVLIGYIGLRVGGWRHAVTGWGAALAMGTSIGGLAYLYDPFKSTVAVLPMLLFLVLCWALVCGQHRLLPLWTLALSIPAAASAQFLSFLFIMTAPTVGVVLVARLRRRVDDEDDADESLPTRGARLRALLPGSTGGRLCLVASAAIVLVAWWGPAYDVLTQRGGNVVKLAEAGRAAGRSFLGLGPALHDTGRAIMFAPVTTRGGQVEGRALAMVGIVVIVALVLTTVAIRRRLPTHDRRLVLVAVGAIAASLINLASIPGEEGFGFARLLASSVTAGLVWFAATNVIADAVALMAERRRQRPAATNATVPSVILPVIVPVIVLGLLATAMSVPLPIARDREWLPWTYAAMPRLAEQVGPRLAAEGVWVMQTVGPVSVRIVMTGLAGSLEEQGRRTDLPRPPGLGEARHQPVGPVAGHLLVVPNALPPSTGWEPLATYDPPDRNAAEAAAAADAIHRFAVDAHATMSPAVVAALPVLLCPERAFGGQGCPAAERALAADDPVAALPPALVAIAYVAHFDDRFGFDAIRSSEPPAELLDRVRRSWVDIPVTVWHRSPT